MKQTVFFMVLVACIFTANAQDYIILKNGQKIEAKVIEITSSKIKYKSFETLDGKTRTVARKNVFVIDYENGYLVVTPIPGKTHTRISRPVPENITKREITQREAVTQEVINSGVDIIMLKNGQEIKSISRPIPENITKQEIVPEHVIQREAATQEVTNSGIDIIMLKNGQEIKAKVTEITLSEIKYKLYEHLDGPARTAAKSDVFAIIYENGTREVITPAIAATAERTPIIPSENKSQAQFTLGIRAGLYYSNQHERYDDIKVKDNIPTPGFQLGAVGRFAIDNTFFIESCILFLQSIETSKSKKNKDNYSKEKLTINYVKIPIHTQYKLSLGDAKIILQAGPYLNYALGGKYKLVEKAEGTYEKIESDLKFGGNPAKNISKPLDFGLGAGIALQSAFIQFGFVYNFGLANISNNEDDKYKERVNGLMFNLTYFFGN